MAKKAPPSIVTKADLLKLFKREERPLSPNDLRLFIEPWKEKKREIKTFLRELSRNGELVRLRGDRYGLPDELNLEVGTLWCTKSGNGFVISEKQGEKDIFVPSRSIGDALHGDKVVVRVEHTNRGKREGRVIRITERKIKQVTGYLRQNKKTFFLVPDDERVSARFVVGPEKKNTGAALHEGDLVAAKVTGFPVGGDPECQIVKVYGSLDDAKKITQFVIYKSGLSPRFPRKAEVEARETDVRIERAGRMDLTRTQHVTIDGEFAKDFDDAVFVEKTKKGFVLYVSIADVSHYVSVDSSLDQEAYQRGTSVYFPGTVVPMLPKRLSNVICSLNPHEERLTVTARLGFDTRGELVQASFDPSIIRSARRLTYRQVENALVGNDKRAKETIRDVMPLIENMGELARLLKARREEKGNLDFDLPEPEVVLDMEGGIKDIIKTERLFSQSIIEEFMIAANVAVARFISEQGHPLTYRVHESPDREKLTDFEGLLHTLGVKYKKDSRGRLPLQKLLHDVRGKEHEFLVNRILLKSMKQARYSAINKGHFGLSLSHYCHFTSPIRRYPDLICHRILKGLVVKKKSDKPLYGDEELERMSVHLSGKERAAMEAERETEDRIRVLFMSGRIGKVYEGVISHITSYGFYVELLDVFVEGVVMLSSLHDDYYTFEEAKFRLIGRRTHKIFRIGDHVKIRVDAADVEKNLLQFGLLRK
jgi:ribonuclease R